MTIEMLPIDCSSTLNRSAEILAKRSGVSRSAALQGIVERALSAFEGRVRLTVGTGNKNFCRCLVIAAELAQTKHTQASRLEQRRQARKRLSVELELRGRQDTSPPEKKAPTEVAEAPEVE